MKLSDIKQMVAELVNEELNEVNYTKDDSGKSTIAIGAPGSVARFATEHPDLVKQMRDWISDCQWADLDNDDIAGLSDAEVIGGVQNTFDGGLRGFIQTRDSKAELPVGYKESIKENWSSGQHDDAPDGYSNDSQRAFAHSQATTPRENGTKKAIELAKQGKFVVVIEAPVYCKSTDGCLGTSIGIHKVCDSRDEAEKEQEKFNNAESSDERVYIIGPDNLEPKQYKDPVGNDDDVPFQENVCGKNPFKVGDEVTIHPKALVRHSRSIPAYMGYTTQQFSWRDTLRKLEGKVGKIERLFPDSKHVNVDFNGYLIGIDYTDLVSTNKPVAEGVGYVHDKDMKKDPKHIAGERWRIKYQSPSDLKKHGNTEMSPVDETMSRQELKETIKDIVGEMWMKK